MNKIMLMTILISGLASTARAQPVEVAAGIAGTTPFEAGDWWSDVRRGGSLDLRVTIPATERFAIEPFVTRAQHAIPLNASAYVSGGDTRRTDGYVGVVVRQRFATPREGLRAFVTYGAAFQYVHEEFPERTYSYVSARVVQPAYVYNQVSPFPLGVGGIGVEQALGRRLAVRGDAQGLMLFVIPVGLRAAADVVVRFGR